ncbi:uncharacterized protein LOC111604403 [Drosophila hydei]|uniref:Uncharacterized protein LOC111604403 n=1 Tax=Drosophila hydei TaxID=7224 RepID=A0A6J1MC45_DROHY|nr:uncharacterized protein LOC111604403 [Drosophila hydei]
MFDAKHFCHCASLRMGCFIIAIITMFLSVAFTKFILVFYGIKYPGNKKGSKDDHTFLLLHLVPEIPVLGSSLILIIHEIYAKSVLILIFVTINGIHIIYIIVISIVSYLMGKNIVLNFAEVWFHVYWSFCLIRIATTIYFIYIALSRWKQIRN